LLAPRPTPKLEDHPLSAVCDCLFNATQHRHHLLPQYCTNYNDVILLIVSTKK